MSARDYMRVNPNNTITIDLNNYTGNAFIDVIKVKDIAQVRILGRNEAKNLPSGSPDVALVSLSGETRYISRQELVNNYEYLSGKKVVIPYMKNNVKYLVVGRCNIPFVAMLLPANMNAILKGKQIPPGTYIVAPKNSDGSIDYAGLTAITRKMFRKMFKVPNQEVIARNMGRNNKVSQRVISKKSRRQKFMEPGRDTANIMGNRNVFSGDMPLADMAANIDNINDATDVLTRNATSAEAPRANTQRKQYPYTAVGAIYDQSNNIVAYKIQDTKGIVKDLGKNQVLAMCDKQLINNLEIVKPDMGTPYLRGRGISLQQLPRYMA